MTTGGRDRLVTVCSACLRASCWQGKFMCDEAQTASTRQMPVAELRQLKLEHPSYWSRACEEGER
jgi:hypothetical protein